MWIKVHFGEGRVFGPFSVAESLGEPSNDLLICGAIPWSSFYVQGEPHPKSRAVPHPSRERLKDVLALIDGVPSDKNRCLRMKKQFPDNNTRVPIRYPWRARPGGHKIEDVLRDNPLLPCFGNQFDGCRQLQGGKAFPSESL